MINEHKSLRVLHFAPEKAFFDYFSKHKNFDYYPVDLFPENYHFDRDCKINKVDITQIPFPEDHFDLILCNHVLEHVVDDNKAMKELFRVLKIGGYGIFQVPIDYNRHLTYEDSRISNPIDRERELGQFDHVRLYGKDYPEKLKNVGFRVLEIISSKNSLKKKYSNLVYWNLK